LPDGVPASPLALGHQYAITVGPGILSAEGVRAQSEEFPFTVEEGVAVGKADVVEISLIANRPAVHIWFNTPINPLSADGAHLLAGRWTRDRGRAARRFRVNTHLADLFEQRREHTYADGYD
jgi:hypothetical protein